MSKVLLVLPILLMGCATGALNAALSEVNKELDANLEKHHVASVQPLVWESMYSDSFKEKYKRDICKEADDCEDKFLETYHRRVKFRYRYAAWDEIQKYCGAFPVKCKNRSYFSISSTPTSDSIRCDISILTSFFEASILSWLYSN